MIYEIQESQDSCPQCLHRKKSSKNSQSSSVADEHQRVVIPIKKRVLKQNKNIQAALNLLHQEVEGLKKQNRLKEKQIEELECKLSQKMSLHQRNAPSKYYNINKEEDSYKNPPLTSRTYYQDYLGSGSKLKRHGSANQFHNFNSIQNQMKQINSMKDEKIEMLEQELSNYQRVCEQLKTRLKEQITNVEWMQHFCISFCGMADQVAQIQGYQLIKSSSLRKKTKASWKFIKDFMVDILN